MNLPTQFGPYLLLERISVGGMAEVYKAKEYGVEGFERTVAVKRILPHVAEDDEFIAMFKDEAKIAVQLQHGNIAQIYNLGNEQDSFYIALEYINGRDLRAIFQKCQQQAKAMPVAQACYIIMKICEGLDYAHNKKDKYNRELHIVHRDVSPPNIIVSFEGEVKLIDFGVAKAAGRASRTQAGILKGKFGYMSPEQVRGMPLDRRSDVFSVGVVLFEILTGQRLFQADTDFATLEKVRAVDVPRPSSCNPEIPKPLENIIYKALAREPEQRYQSAIELHDELQAFMFAQGLFYSRKDLAGWMRTQYAREIELEKEKASASVPPPAGDPVVRARKTIMMPPGAAGPPPPPGAKKTGGPPPPPAASAGPPPPPRAPTPAAIRASGATPSTASPSGGGQAGQTVEEPAAKRAVKRKTMVMTTARPNLPPPPGAGPPKPRPRPAPASASNDAPTVPISAGLPRPNGASRPKATQSYAATAVPPSSEFDWDDDELETRLFEDGDKPRDELPTFAGGMRDADRPPSVGGELATKVDLEGPEPPTIAASVTIVPGGVTMPDPAFARGLTMVPSAAPQMGPPPTHNPFGPHPGGTTLPQMHMPAQGMPQAPHPGMQQQGHPGMGAPMGFAGNPQAMPQMHMQHQAVYDDERPAGKTSAGLVIGILAAAVVLVGAGFGAVYLYSQSRAKQSGTTETASASTTTPDPSAARSGLTIQTTPADAQVHVDGKEVAGGSPFVVSDLTSGKHKVAVAREGFLPFEREVDVGAGGLSLPVTLQHRDVTLVLESDPPGAAMNLVVNGQTVSMGAGGSQYKLVRDAAATYQIEASLGGYQPGKQDLSFTGEPSQKVRIVLTRDTAIAANVPPATPPVDPTNPGNVTPTPVPTPTPTPAHDTTRPRPPKPPREKPPKPPAPPSGGAKTATLKIGVLPGNPPATVSVDGRSVGTTPIPGLKLAPGKHKVQMKWADGREFKQSVDVAEGETQTVKGG